MGEFPNKNTQFSSENQPKHNGRPKGAKNFSTRIKELLAGMSSDNDWTSPLAAEKVKIIFSKDKKGNYIFPCYERQKAIDSILDRIEGKPEQRNVNENINHNTYLDLTEEELKQKKEQILKEWKQQKKLSK